MLEYVERAITERYREKRNHLIKLDKLQVEYPMANRKEEIIEAKGFLAGLQAALGIVQTARLTNELPLEFKNSM